MTKLQAKYIIITIWIVSLLTPFPTAFLSKLVQQGNLTDRYTCMEVWDNNEHRYYYSMTLMILQYAFPLSVLIYTYARIAVVVWGKQTPGEAQDARDQRMAQSKRKVKSHSIIFFSRCSCFSSLFFSFFIPISISIIYLFCPLNVI